MLSKTLTNALEAVLARVAEALVNVDFTATAGKSRMALAIKVGAVVRACARVLAGIGVAVLVEAIRHVAATKALPRIHWSKNRQRWRRQ